MYTTNKHYIALVIKKKVHDPRQTSECLVGISVFRNKVEL